MAKKDKKETNIEESTEEFLFINKSKNNLFTESGPCRPGYEVILTAKQAKKYKGLEKS